MNKIFKVIFNKAKGIFVVTGENTKAQGKSKHLKAIAASVMIASALGMAENAEAKTKEQINDLFDFNAPVTDVIEPSDNDYSYSGDGEQNFTLNNDSNKSAINITGKHTTRKNFSVDNLNTITITDTASNYSIYGSYANINLGTQNNGIGSLIVNSGKSGISLANTSSLNIHANDAIAINAGQKDPNGHTYGIYTTGTSTASLDTNTIKIVSNMNHSYDVAAKKYYSATNTTIDDILVKNNNNEFVAPQETTTTAYGYGINAISGSEIDLVAHAKDLSEGQYALDIESANTTINVSGAATTTGTTDSDGYVHSKVPTIASNLSVAADSIHLSSSAGNAISIADGAQATFTNKDSEGNNSRISIVNVEAKSRGIFASSYLKDISTKEGSEIAYEEASKEIWAKSSDGTEYKYDTYKNTSTKTEAVKVGENYQYSTINLYADKLAVTAGTAVRADSGAKINLDAKDITLNTNGNALIASGRAQNTIIDRITSYDKDVFTNSNATNPVSKSVTESIEYTNLDVTDDSDKSKITVKTDILAINNSSNSNAIQATNGIVDITAEKTEINGSYVFDDPTSDNYGNNSGGNITAVTGGQVIFHDTGSRDANGKSTQSLVIRNGSLWAHRSSNTEDANLVKVEAGSVSMENSTFLANPNGSIQLGSDSNPLTSFVLDRQQPSVGNSNGAIVARGGSIEINAENTSISTSNIDYAILATSVDVSNTPTSDDSYQNKTSQININSGNLTVNGNIGATPTSYNTKQDITNDTKAPIGMSQIINLNTTGKTEINGDIITINTITKSNDTDPGTVSNASINVSLNTSDSVLNGAVIDQYGDKWSEQAPTTASSDSQGTTLIMNNGATWNVKDAKVAQLDETGAPIRDDNGNIMTKSVSNAVKTITSSNSTINNTTNAQIQVGTLNTESGETTYNTTHNDEGQLSVGSRQGDGTLRINLINGQATNQLGGSNTNETAKRLTDLVDIKSGNQSAHFTAAEGDIIGQLDVLTDAQGNMVQVSEQKNRVMESLKDIGINNFLSFRAQMNDLDKRMGDLRTMPNTDGAWARLIAGQSQYQSNHNTYKTLQVGVDHRIGSFVLGGMASYTDGDGTLKQGSTDDTLYSFGLYGAWMNDDGQFVDVTLKRHHVASDYDLHYLGGQKAKGSFDTSGTSLSAEYGWRLGITNTNYYIEPQVELMYGHLNRFNYKTSNGVKIEQDAMKTLVGRFGVAAGWVSPDKAGSAYAKISVLNDWEGDADSKAKKDNTSRRYHEDMGGTWVEYALGGTYNLTKHLSAYGELETTSGSPTRTTYQVSAGLRWSF